MSSLDMFEHAQRKEEASSYLAWVEDEVIKEEYVRRFTISVGKSLRDVRIAADHFRGYYAHASKREHFVVCFLNTQFQVLRTEVLFVGSIATSAVYPREVIERVLELGAGAVMFSHNHPSGDINPSSSDRAVTRKLAKALEAIDVSVLDHIIVGGLAHFSFADHNLL